MRMERARYTATLASIGLRAEASLAKHLLLENCWENNLLPDISKVDYFEGHQGRTNLQPLDGLPLFVDDIYICGYLDQTEVVRARGTLSCEPVSKQIVQRISAAVQEVLGGPRKNTRVSNTVLATSRGSKIVETIAKIESDTGQRARRQWERLFPEKEVFACFVAKVDVSAVDIVHLQERLPTLARLLESRGDSMYEIDYTQDFSGMVDKDALVSHLLANGFAMQGSGEYSDKGTILDNTRSVGEHVCTWIHIAIGYTVRTKVYNKVVSQFEAGEVNETFGGHLADYVDCPNQHMQRTFEHPGVQARGCTRIEASFYGSEALSIQTDEALVAAALAEVQVENEENGLFVVQPPAQQWNNLAKNLSCCFRLADRPQGTLWMAWSGHTKTGRLQGIVVKPTPKTLEREGAWERAILCTIADFGFRNCPIFAAEILGVENNEVVLSPVYCFQKNAPTILAASRRPLQLHPGAPDPQTLLPPTEHVEWVWRPKKAHAIGTERPSCPLWEVPEIAANRRLSTLSTRNRALRLEQILEERTRQEWGKQLEEIARAREEARRLRRQEIEQMRKIVAEKKRLLAESEEIRRSARHPLRTKNEKIRDVAGERWKVLGHRQATYGPRVALEDKEGRTEVVYSTKQLAKLLENTKEIFLSKEDWYGREMFYAASEKKSSKSKCSQPNRSTTRTEYKSSGIR